MQDNEKINYDNYEFMYDKNGYSRGEGIPIFKDVFDFFNVIENFVLTEITNKGKDFSEFGKYLDYNLAYNSYQGVDFLYYLYFVYEPYFSQDLKDYRVSWIEEFNPIHQYEIAEYVKNWIDGKVKLIGKNSLDEIGKRSKIIVEMYATLPTQPTLTPAPQAEEKQKVGRPRAKENPLHDDIRKEFMRLTITNPTTIDKSKAKLRLINTTFNDNFTQSSIESKLARLNTILRTKSNNN